VALDFENMDHDAIRAAMAEKAGARDIGVHGNAAVNNGMPPSDRAVMSPLALQISVEAGDIAMVDTPMGMLRAALESTHGPAQGIDHSANYAAAAAPSSQNVASMAVDLDLGLNT